MLVGYECPSEMLDEIQPLGDFDFVLAHLVLRDKIYHDHYQKKSGHALSRMLILDNSVNELGVPCSIEEMVEAAIEVSPNFIVPPDFLGDSDETLRSLSTFTKLVSTELPGVLLLPVVQGSSSNDCVKCSMLIQQRGFNRVAVPYDITSKKTDSLMEMATRRIQVVHRISEGYTWIHLLGMTRPGEFEAYRNLPKAVKLTLDTGSPILHGLHGITLKDGPLFDKTQCSLERMDGAKGNLRLVQENIQYLRGLVNGIG